MSWNLCGGSGSAEESFMACSVLISCQVPRSYQLDVLRQGGSESRWRASPERIVGRKRVHLAGAFSAVDISRPSRSCKRSHGSGLVSDGRRTACYAEWWRRCVDMANWSASWTLSRGRRCWTRKQNYPRCRSVFYCSVVTEWGPIWCSGLVE